MNDRQKTAVNSCNASNIDTDQAISAGINISWHICECPSDHEIWRHALTAGKVSTTYRPPLEIKSAVTVSRYMLNKLSTAIG
jgi:hypothetical protein